MSHSRTHESTTPRQAARAAVEILGATAPAVDVVDLAAERNPHRFGTAAYDTWYDALTEVVPRYLA